MFILNFLNLFQVYIIKNDTEIHQCLSCGDPHYHPLLADTFGQLVNYFFLQLCMIAYVLPFDFHNTFTIPGTGKFCVQVLVADVEFQEVIHEGRNNDCKKKKKKNSFKKKIERSSHFFSIKRQ